MGKYTAADDEKIDAKIEHDLQCIATEIRKHLKPVSVILTGSFGRGEGTVIKSDGKLHFLSDYEICVVSSKVKTRKICALLSDSLSRRLGVETSVAWISTRRFKLNKNKNISKGRSYPSIFMYELKTGSKVLYGRETGSVNVIEPQDIYLWEGIKLILNRMVESFAPSPVKNTKYAREKQINKILLACGDSLLLHAKKYHYSYKERKNRIISCLDIKNYPFLSEKDLEYITRAYDAKLYGQFDWHHELDPSAVYKLSDGVLRFLLGEEMDISFASYAAFPEKYWAGKGNFYRYYAFRFYFLTNPVFENIIYLIKLFKWRRYPNIKIIKYIRIPFHHLVYSVVPPLFFFDFLSGEDREDIVTTANKVLSVFNESFAGNIEEIKRGISAVWYRICFGKDV